MFTKILIFLFIKCLFTFLELSITNNGRKIIYGNCYACGYPVEKQVSSTAPVIIHEELIKLEARKQHARLHMNLEQEVNPHRLYSEDDFVTDVLTSLKVALYINKDVGRTLL